MNIGERIKERRKEMGLSVDDIADKLGKNRATIYRYESNDIENLPITILEPLARVLGTTPIYLLGLEEAKFNLEPQPTTLTQDESTLLSSYNKLNDIGKHEAKKRVNELTSIPNYIDVTNIEGAREYLKLFKMAAYGGQDINLLPDEKIIERAIALKEEFEK